MSWPGWESFTPDAGPLPVKRNKFNARTRCIDGVNFGSSKEARRWLDLKLLEAAGAIQQLEAHPRFDLVVNGVHVGFYTADSRYVTKDGEAIVEDVKGGRSTKTEAYSLRKRLFEAVHWPLQVSEV